MHKAEKKFESETAKKSGTNDHFIADWLGKLTQRSFHIAKQRGRFQFILLRHTRTFSFFYIK